MQETRKRRFSREVDRTPMDETGKKMVAKIIEYYKKCEEARKKGLPLPEPPGTRSPLDREKK